MKLFGKATPKSSAVPPESISGGRRRPATDRAEDRPQAFSYYAQRSTAPAHLERTTAETIAENKRPQVRLMAALRIANQNRIVLTISGLLLLAGLLYMLALGGMPKIATTNISGGAYFMQNTQVYQQAAARTLSGSLFNSNKLTVDTAKVSTELMSQYPELSDVSVELPLFGRNPVVHVAPYPPAFILTTTSSGAFLIDTNGRALVSASQITDNGELAVPTLEDKSGVSVKLGKQIVSSTTVDFARYVVAVLDAAPVKYSRLVLPAGTSELDVYITGKPYFVKFNLQGDAKMQAGTFLATKKRLEVDRTAPGQYIDVRVPERAYYK